MNDEPNEKLKELQEKWYQKLKESGFIDIEYKCGAIKQTHTSTKRRAYQDQAKREAYFDAAYQFLFRHKWPSKKLERLWDLHCQGFSVRKIAKELKMHHATVYYKIKTLRKLCNLKR